MKARISAGWSHDTSHFQFLRQTPDKQARIPFVADEDMPEFKEALLGTLVFAAFVGTLIFLPLMLGGAP
jgi:hypothetical protein